MLNDFRQLLRQNRNYRYTWLGQVVSETGDYFNNIAVFSLVMTVTGSGLVVSGVMLSRAIPAEERDEGLQPMDSSRTVMERMKSWSKAYPKPGSPRTSMVPRGVVSTGG